MHQQVLQLVHILPFEAPVLLHDLQILVIPATWMTNILIHIGRKEEKQKNKKQQQILNLRGSREPPLLKI